MRFSFHRTEAETIALYVLMEKFLDAMVRVMEVPARAPSEAAPSHPEPTVSAPEPVVEAPVEPAAPDERTLRRIERGRVLFTEMAVMWASNLGIDGAPQPDRVGILRSVATGPEAGAVLNYVSSVGGLTHATDRALTWDAFNLKRLTDHCSDEDGPIYLRQSETPEETEAARRACVAAVAINIAQVSSLFFSDLCAMYEHRDIYRED